MKKKILWIEDDSVITESLISDTTKYYDYDFAFSKKEAIDKLSKDNYDCVIIDLIIPTSGNDFTEYENIEGEYFPNGLLIMKDLRKKGITIPIIIFSVVSDDRILNIIQKYNALFMKKSLVTPKEFNEIIYELI